MSKSLSAVDDANRAGIDVGLIEESLGYSYEQRALHHQETLNLALELERVGRELREQYQSPEV